MKHLSIFLLATLLSSCCGTKKVLREDSKSIAKVEISKTEEVHNQTPKVEDTKMEVPREITKSDTPSGIPLPPKPPKRVIDTLSNERFNHGRWDSILQKYVSDSGEVDYIGIKNNPGELVIYLDTLSENLPENSWSQDDKLAYWINAYNAMTIDLILRHFPVKSIKDIKDPWKQRYWQLGKKWYNLDQIEHQIIRKMGEPRIHFALVCAAVSCPKLYNKAFTASSLDEDLSKLTREFLADTSKNSISENELKLSKIFSWFAKDFKQGGSIIDFLNQYTEVKISDKAKKRFNTYNWDLND